MRRTRYLAIGGRYSLLERWLPAGLLFGRGEVADDLVFRNLIDHQLVGLLCLARVELHGLVDVLILLLGQLIVRHYFDRVLVLLRVGLLEKQGNIADALPVLGLAQLELEVVALTQAPERLQFAGIGGDESTL